LFCRAGEARAQLLVKLQIDISTAAGGATVNGQTGLHSTGFFDVDFGNLNGLGIGTRPAGLSVQRQTGGALYTTPILVTPVWTCTGGCPTGGTVTVKLDSTYGTSAGRNNVREGASAGSTSALTTTERTITTTAANNVPLTRYIGLFVSNANGGGRVNGSMAVRVIYTISIP
jgi:hypothetical protein